MNDRLTLLRAEQSERSPLKPYLLLDPEDERGVDFDFMSEAVKRFEEDDTIKPAFISAVEDMSRELAGMTVNDDHKPYVIVCCTIPSSLNTLPTSLLAGVTKPCPAPGDRYRHHGVVHVQCIS